MIINRFLPNPVGPDKTGEWIEILNNSGEVINLADWQIKDLSGKSYVFKSGELKSGESFRFNYETSKIALNNNGETLFLYDPNGALASKLTFSGIAEEGRIISQKIDNKPAESKGIGQQGVLADSLFVNSVIFINLALALILASVFFWIIKNLYHDYFEPVAVGN